MDILTARLPNNSVSLAQMSDDRLLLLLLMPHYIIIAILSLCMAIQMVNLWLTLVWFIPILHDVILVQS